MWSYLSSAATWGMPRLCPTSSRSPSQGDHVHDREALPGLVAIEDFGELVLGHAAGPDAGDPCVGVAHPDVLGERHVVAPGAEEVELRERPFADAGDGGDPGAIEPVVDDLPRRP